MRHKLIGNICKALGLCIVVGTIFVNSSISVLAAPKVMKDGTVFDAEYYAQRYTDVAAIYGTDEAALFQHYIVCGKIENREAVKVPDINTFDPIYYAQQNPDVVAVCGDGTNNLYQHYLQYGIKEGRKPTASEVAASAPMQTAPTAQTSGEKLETSSTIENVQITNSPANEKVIRRGTNVTGWDVIQYQSQSEMFGFPVDDCFETASGVYVVCKGWICKMFASGNESCYGQHALWNLGAYGTPYGSKWAQEGVDFWKIN